MLDALDDIALNDIRWVGNVMESPSGSIVQFTAKDAGTSSEVRAIGLRVDDRDRSEGPFVVGVSANVRGRIFDASMLETLAGLDVSDLVELHVTEATAREVKLDSVRPGDVVSGHAYERDGTIAPGRSAWIVAQAERHPGFAMYAAPGIVSGITLTPPARLYLLGKLKVRKTIKRPEA